MKSQLFTLCLAMVVSTGVGYVTHKPLPRGFTTTRKGITITDVGSMSPLITVQIPQPQKMFYQLAKDIPTEKMAILGPHIRSLLKVVNKKYINMFRKLENQLHPVRPVPSRGPGPDDEDQKNEVIFGDSKDGMSRRKRFVVEGLALGILALVAVTSSAAGITGAIMGSQAKSQVESLNNKITYLTEQQDEILKAVNGLSGDIKTLKTVGEDMSIAISKQGEALQKILDDLASVRTESYSASTYMAKLGFILSTEYSSWENAVTQLLHGKVSFPLVTIHDFSDIIMMHSVNTNPSEYLKIADLLYTLSEARLLAVDRTNGLIMFTMFSPLLESSKISPLYRVVNVGFSCEHKNISSRCVVNLPEHFVPVDNDHPNGGPVVFPEIKNCRSVHDIYLCGSTSTENPGSGNVCWTTNTSCQPRILNDVLRYEAVSEGWVVYLPDDTTDILIDPTVGSNYKITLGRGAHLINCTNGENLQIGNHNLITQKQISWNVNLTLSGMPEISAWVDNQSKLLIDEANTHLKSATTNLNMVRGNPVKTVVGPSNWLHFDYASGSDMIMTITLGMVIIILILLIRKLYIVKKELDSLSQRFREYTNGFGIDPSRPSRIRTME